VEDLVLDAGNPRQHSQRQVNQIADSIREFGFVMPVVIDHDKRVVIGHGRVLAAKRLGMAKVPVIEIHHLSKAQMKALRIADNKLALNASWDERSLGESLLEIKELDIEFDLSLTGFAIPEIEIIIDDLNADPPAPEEEDDASTGEPVCVLGDVWKCGEHLVFCGDATKDESFATLMKDTPARMVFTDPPYNIRIDGTASGKGKVKHREFAQGSGEMSVTEFNTFLTTACSLLRKYSADGSIHFVCMDWRHAADVLEAGKRIYSELKNINVWVKDNAGMGSLYRSQHEFVFVFKSGNANHVNNIELGKHGRNRSNVWRYDSANTRSRKGDNLLALHPTAKPVDLVIDAMRDCSNKGDIVLDAFLGSGTSLLAAERAGRICRAIELDPLYVDTAVRRWQNLTGRSAVRVSDGKLFRELENASEEIASKN
jgi:DNA modification methylase